MTSYTNNSTFAGVDFREKKWQFLFWSILLDLLSMATFALPLIGEVSL